MCCDDTWLRRYVVYNAGKYCNEYRVNDTSFTHAIYKSWALAPKPCGY